jgi:hypothetical protein
MVIRNVLKMEAGWSSETFLRWRKQSIPKRNEDGGNKSSETLVSYQITTRFHNPDDRDMDGQY